MSKTKRLRGKTKRSAAATKLKKDLAADPASEPSMYAPYGVSKIKLGGKMSFVGANRRMVPVFSEWWEDLLQWIPEGDPPPNIDLAHKAYMEGSSVGHYAGFLDDQRSSVERGREAQHSVDLRNRITGQDPRLKISRDALVSKLLDTARRLDRELAQLRQDLDRLRTFD